MVTRMGLEPIISTLSSGTRGGIRTHNLFTGTDFESAAYACSATRARCSKMPQANPATQVSLYRYRMRRCYATEYVSLSLWTVVRDFPRSIAAKALTGLSPATFTGHSENKCVWFAFSIAIYILVFSECASATCANVTLVPRHF